MISHSDYRKYDEQLRMVIDCRSEMRDRIRAALEDERRAGAILFGLHASGSALMTCFLQSFDEGGHIHFVDGSDGGYAVLSLATGAPGDVEHLTIHYSLLFDADPTRLKFIPAEEEN